MKLYTEEQVIEMIEKSRQTGLTAEYLILTTTPIELPSDEEIRKSRDEHIPIDEIDVWSERFYFTIGARWMLHKIQIRAKPTQPMKTFKQYLKSLKACSAAIMWAGDKTIEQVVTECQRGDWLLWLANKCGVELQPLTLAKAHCANTVRHLMSDERSVKAVDVAIAFGEGKATRDELDAASAAATDAASAAAAYAASAAAAASAASDATAAAAAYAAYAAASAANKQQTADICRKYIGELIIEKVNQHLNQ